MKNFNLKFIIELIIYTILIMALQYFVSKFLQGHYDLLSFIGGLIGALLMLFILYLLARYSKFNYFKYCKSKKQ